MCRKSSRYVLPRRMHPWCDCMVKWNPRVLLRWRHQLRRVMCTCMVKRNRLSNLASKLRNAAVGRETSERFLVSVSSWRRGDIRHLRDVALVGKKVNHSPVENIHRLLLIICYCPRSGRLCARSWLARHPAKIEITGSSGGSEHYTKIFFFFAKIMIFLDF